MAAVKSWIANITDRVLHTRALVRAPIWVYRAGLGFVFGSRLLMLEHIGRTTGARRYVVLEVIDHPSPDVYVIASGFGVQAQWFRNVMADARVRISVGGRRGVAATARRLSPGEADLALSRYIERHPRAWESLRTVIEGALHGRVAPPGTEVPMVEIRVR
ncbi:MAG: nitroreductase family deazaflavin-dependent oxidoreductase [Mycolicibacterium sp.]